MTKGLRRFYGHQDLHFITCSCYHRLPLLATSSARDGFAATLNEVRVLYSFGLVGYVVMPEHFHLLMTEPEKGTPSTVLQVLKQRTSRRMQGEETPPFPKLPERMGHRIGPGHALPQFWQRRFYDFNVWSQGKISEKLDYMHMNPVSRGLVADPKDWPWSSYGFYARGDAGLVRIDPA
ncbi:MAG TPA: transposase [Candidatus Acidoferrales bacterium]|nr:transposase [Candidatus Acidoferrales bacterium]